MTIKLNNRTQGETDDFIIFLNDSEELYDSLMSSLCATPIDANAHKLLDLGEMIELIHRLCRLTGRTPETYLQIVMTDDTQLDTHPGYSTFTLDDGLVRFDDIDLDAPTEDDLDITHDIPLDRIATIQLTA